MLTDRANEFLATLERVPFVPTKYVEELLLDGCCPSVDKWLEFHEKYAGYVEDLGKDKAVWGLVHREPRWLEPLSAEVDYDKKENSYDIVCADVHPSYNYILTDSGEFWGVPSESFDVYVERKSIGYEFSLNGNVKPVAKEDFDESILNSVLTNDNFVSEASDRFYNYFCCENFFID